MHKVSLYMYYALVIMVVEMSTLCGQIKVLISSSFLKQNLVQMIVIPTSQGELRVSVTVHVLVHAGQRN